MKQLFSATPIAQSTALAVLRIITGLLMAYHGLEVFKPDVIKGYAAWDIIKNMPAPLFMAYLGKGLELVTGLCFVVGLFTRVAALFMSINMLFICFKIGGGKFYYEDQHPFLFALIALLFFFTGPVKWALDCLWFKPKYV